MVDISYHDRGDKVQDLPFLSSGPFSRLEWFKLLEHYDYKPLIALAYKKNEALALPLYQGKYATNILANWYSFTWAPLATKGADRQSLLRSLARDMRGKFTRIIFDKLPGEDGSVDLLTDAYRRAGWLCFCETSDINHLLRVGGRSYEDYYTSLPGHLRSTLKRKTSSIETEIITHFQDDIWSLYDDVYEKSWKGSEGNPALLKAFAETESRLGHIRIGLARYKGNVIAAQFWTVEDGTAYIHKLAYDDDFKRLSSGSILTAAMMRYVIDEDHVDLVDFGTGDDAYKADWMNATRPRFRVTCYRPELPQNWPQIGRQVLRKLVLRSRAG
ncbi:GNAT family N-acetyltransferase [Altericroceibacterium spongiae]|uniref:GNAT family N-acetyltransferase n=1 Tax=Altericroceibacterium spongiae TaxID=2320269 RepID=A0A420ERC7_9SPHN|nr:GNAT family N-acetyltransferase [Altericroceibacterium spongiae]RKF23235.1 GNAT family N-acetyltransferase [Altericroceibacterium spongiae]